MKYTFGLNTIDKTNEVVFFTQYGKYSIDKEGNLLVSLSTNQWKPVCYDKLEGDEFDGAILAHCSLLEQTH